VIGLKPDHGVELSESGLDDEPAANKPLLNEPRMVVGAHPPTLRVRQRVGLWDLFTRLYNGQTDWPTGCLVNKRAAYKFQAPIFTPGDYLQRTPFGAPKEVFGKTHKSRRRGYWIPK
jgi:hypothetical protein